MFTDFLAECRAHKLQVNIPKNDIMGAAKVDATFAQPEASRPIAVAA
jgi:carbamoyl-phosphate synthase small subunit